MPSPHDKQQYQHREELPRLANFFGDPEPGLAAEVAALRKEIAALRAELKPVSSLILTGQQVAAEFQRLNGSRA